MAVDWIVLPAGAVLAFALSLVGVRAMIATGFGLSADVPNARSMHNRVVPRGGGLAFVVATLVTLAGFGPFVLQSGDRVWYIVPFAAMALLGWLDDRLGLGVVTRLMAQLACAALVALMLLEDLGAGVDGIAFAGWGVAVVLITVWVTNLYNFMDGMDGLAASQAVIVLATMALWFAGVGAVDELFLCVVLAAAVAGFLVVNWHPARVFMGDTGSLALGVVVAALSFGGVFTHGLPGGAFIILMGVFLFDTTFTLLRRILRGERWWQSHRSHLYQRAQAAGVSQPRIVSAVIGMDAILVVLATLMVLDLTGWLPASIGAALVLIAPVAWIRRRERLMTSMESAGRSKK